MNNNTELFEQRQKLIEELIEFNNTEINRICSLDGAWGSGKSFFIDKFIERVNSQNNALCNSKDETSENTLAAKTINNHNFNVLKFDAWENQGVENINAIFLEKIYDELLSREYEEKSVIEYIKKNKKDIIKDVVLTGINCFIPTIVGETFDKTIKNYENFQDALIYETFNNQMLNQILDERKFYDVLIEMLTPDEKHLIIIDELDRCEPKFAMNMIKKVIYLNKLLKTNDKPVNFLIAINKEEFANLLTGYYGQTYNTEQYFDKIFDYEFSLPNAKTAEEYIAMQLPTIKIPVKITDGDNVNNIIKDFLEKLNYRQLNILIEKIKKPQNPERYPIHPFDRARLILEIVKLRDYQEYLKIKTAVLRLRKQNEKYFFLETSMLGKEKITLVKKLAATNDLINDIKLISKCFVNINDYEISENKGYEIIDDGFYETLKFDEEEIKDFEKNFSLTVFELLKNTEIIN